MKLLFRSAILVLSLQLAGDRACGESHIRINQLGYQPAGIKVAVVLGQDALPANFQLDRTVIEDWIRLAQPLTADENAPGRSAVPETTTVTFSRDEDLSLAAERVSISAEMVDEMLTSLKQSWSRAEAAITALTRPSAVPADGIALRAALADLQGGVAAAIDRTVIPVAGGFVAVEEALAIPSADEGLDPSSEVLRLQGELTRIEATIEALRTVATSGSEENSPAAATEAGASERETSARGE